MSRITLTILAGAGITLIAGAWFIVAPYAPAGHDLLLSLAAIGQPQPGPSPVIPAPAEATKHHHDSAYNVSFDYPADATIQNLSADNGDIILVTRPGQDLEVHITSSDRDQITESDIREEAGTSLVQGPTRSFLVAGIPIVRADLKLQNLGLAPHAWFLRHGYQYQLVASANARPLLEQVLTAWCFQDEPLNPGQRCVGKLNQ